MRLKLFIRSFIVFTLLLIPVFANSATVPWSSQTYSVLARSGEDIWFSESLHAEDSGSGSAPPVSAYAEYIPGFGRYASSEITATTMYMDCSFGLPAKRCQMVTSFSGIYLANDPLFLFSYSSNGWFDITIEDVTTSSTLLSQQIFSGSDMLYIPTTIGNEISVSFGKNTGELCCQGEFHQYINYSMAVVPEPISSILFVTGGTLFAGRNFLRKRRRS